MSHGASQFHAISDCQEGGGDLRIAQGQQKGKSNDDSSNYNNNIKELTAEMMWDNPNFNTDEEDQ